MTAPRTFWVTVRRDVRTGWLLGPYPTREAAERAVWRGRALAERADAWSAFDAFGVASPRDAGTASRIRPVFSADEAAALGPDPRPRRDIAPYVYVGDEHDDPEPRSPFAFGGLPREVAP